MNDNRKAIAKKQNSKGVIFALVSGQSSFEIWKLCENYNRECKGGMKKTWRYVEKGMIESAAKEKFAILTK